MIKTNLSYRSGVHTNDRVQSTHYSSAKENQKFSMNRDEIHRRTVRLDFPKCIWPIIRDQIYLIKGLDRLDKTTSFCKYLNPPIIVILETKNGSFCFFPPLQDRSYQTPQPPSQLFMQCHEGQPNGRGCFDYEVD